MNGCPVDTQSRDRVLPQQNRIQLPQPKIPHDSVGFLLLHTFLVDGEDRLFGSSYPDFYSVEVFFLLQLIPDLCYDEINIIVRKERLV